MSRWTQIQDHYSTHVKLASWFTWMWWIVLNESTWACWKGLIKTSKIINACSLGNIWNLHQNNMQTGQKKSKWKGVFYKNRELFYITCKAPWGRKCTRDSGCKPFRVLPMVQTSALLWNSCEVEKSILVTRKQMNKLIVRQWEDTRGWNPTIDMCVQRRPFWLISWVR